jgi:hypothetical protein
VVKRFLALAVLAACGVNDGPLETACKGVHDPRPETLAYITETILAPSCGTAECHSAKKQAAGFVFDSVAGAQNSIADNKLITLTNDLCGPECGYDPFKSILSQVISTNDVGAFGKRMPLDQPLPNLDVCLISDWLINGAAGYTPPPPSP